MMTWTELRNSRFVQNVRNVQTGRNVRFVQDAKGGVGAHSSSCGGVPSEGAWPGVGRRRRATQRPRALSPRPWVCAFACVLQLAAALRTLVRESHSQAGCKRAAEARDHV